MSIIEKAVDRLGKDGAHQQGAGQVENINEGEPTPSVSAEEPAERRDTNGLPQSATTKDATEVVVSLPLRKLRAQGMLTPDATRSQIAEEYRMIKRPLLMNIDKKGATIVDNANMIMVTSARQGDGKTFTAINLAMSISMEEGRTVLLIDGDVAKPDAANQLGVEAQEGLIDLLTTPEMTLKDVIVQTNVPNLRIVSAGRFHERATELLASAGMQTLMNELSERYPDRVVIFDSPPLLRASEASVMANLMGQIVMVVSAERTPQHAVTDALAKIDGDKIVGLVLNKFSKNITNQYGYGYGYGRTQSQASQ